MPSINPALIPSITGKNLFQALTEQEQINIRWMTNEDKVYFNHINRPMADLAVRQLIIAKSIVEFSLDVAAAGRFPFLLNPVIVDGASEVDVPDGLVNDFNIIHSLDASNMRLGRIDLLSSDMDGDDFAGKLRLIFVVTQDDEDKGLGYVEYDAASTLSFQRATFNVITDGSLGFEPLGINPSSVTARVVLKTLDASDINIEEFYDFILDGSGQYLLKDSTPTDELSTFSETVSMGTGLLRETVIHRLPGVEFNISTDIDMNGQRIIDLADAVDGNDAINLEQALDLFLARSGATPWTGPAPLNMNGHRIVGLQKGIDNDDAVRVSQLDLFLERDGTSSWIGPNPLDMSPDGGSTKFKIVNLADGVDDNDAINRKQAVDGSLEWQGPDPLNMNGFKVVGVADGESANEVITYAQFTATRREKLLESRTLSDQNLMTLNSWADLAFSRFRIEMIGITVETPPTSTDDEVLRLQTSDDGGTSWDTAYDYQGGHRDDPAMSSASVDNIQLTGGAHTDLDSLGVNGQGLSDDVGRSFSADLMLLHASENSLYPVLKGTCHYHRDDTGQIVDFSFTASRINEQTVNAFRIFTATGANMIDGTIRVWGVE